jgi:hypothetical protein
VQAARRGAERERASLPVYRVARLR